MLATSQQQDVAAQNLAHSGKPGYRREMVRFESLGGLDEFTGPSVSVHSDQTSGGFEPTGNPLDVAISGSGMFVFDGPSGPMYSRCGVFQLNGEGQMVTPEGFPVQGIAGPITLPSGAKAIEITNNGGVVADGVDVDQLRIVEFTDSTKLERVSTSSFAAPKGIEPSQLEQPHLRQGVREMSNTSAVQEMVQMTTGLRQFEATQRALRAIGDAIGLTTRPTGK
jgi:flagellar basal body rod protein FlgG